MEENQTKIKPRSTIKKSNKKLPWWIELFFVQIGLPEKILVKLLTYEKKLKAHIDNKASRYRNLLLISLFMIYFYPLIQESRNKNICINNTSQSIKEIPNKELIKQIAVSYCNGGDNIDYLR